MTDVTRWRHAAVAGLAALFLGPPAAPGQEAVLPPPDPEAFRAVLAARDAPLTGATLDVVLVKRHKVFKPFTEAQLDMIGNNEVGYGTIWPVPTGEFENIASRLAVTYGDGGTVRLERTTLDPAEAEDLRRQGGTEEISAPPVDVTWIQTPVGTKSVERTAGTPGGPAGEPAAPEVFEEEQERDAAALMLTLSGRDVGLGVGVGLGAHLTRIDTLEPRGAGYALTGVAEFLPGVVEGVTAELDADLIVRRCELRIATPDSETVSFYTTTGTKPSAAGMAVAAAGTFVEKTRLRQPGSGGGEPTFGEWETLTAEAYSTVGLEAGTLGAAVSDPAADGGERDVLVENGAVPATAGPTGTSFPSLPPIGLAVLLAAGSLSIIPVVNRRTAAGTAATAHSRALRSASLTMPAATLVVGLALLTHDDPAAAQVGVGNSPPITTTPITPTQTIPIPPPSSPPTSPPPVIPNPTPTPPEPEQDCGDCSVGWYGASNLFGSGECEHGPEHDPDCIGTPAPCEEYQGVNQRPPGPNFRTDGICHCFLCGVAAGCEPAPEHWQAKCAAPQNPSGDRELCAFLMECSDRNFKI